MKCQAVHSALLSSEKPHRLPADVVAHLKECARCRVWQRRLVRLEQNVALMPVPSAPTGREAFVRQFLAAPVEDAPACAETAENASVDSSTMLHVRRFDKLAAALRATLDVPQKTLRSFPAPARRRVAAVLAASLLLVASLLWFGGPLGPLPKRSADPLLAQVMRHDVRLASAQTPRERIEALAGLADVLQIDTRELIDAAGPAELNTLAKCYADVVDEGIVKQASLVPVEDRAAVLEGITRALRAAGDDAERLARVRPEASAGPLRTIANAARKGESSLEGLAAGERAMNNQPPLPPVLFASLVFAKVPEAPSAKMRANQLRRNVSLIEKAVQNSLALAGDQDPLQRAVACAAMADELAREIRQASDANDSARALELAQHLYDVLKQGVSANLTAARSKIPSGSADERKLLELQERTVQDMGDLEEKLPPGSEALDDRSVTRLTVHEGRAVVEKAVKRVKVGG